MQTIGRFAPSPSGRMHLGNVFSALLAWLSVRSSGGRMLLRIEDLDPDRCRPEYAEQLKRDLSWLGLDWDEEQTPQSRMGQSYAESFSILAEKDLVYPCYCSRAQLHAASAPHASDGQTVYAGTCRHLTAEQRKSMTKSPRWRIKVPDRTISFTDGLQGLYSEELQKECGDFILRRADGVFAYQLAVVHDDALGGVTQIVRGCDLLSSVPRQIYLQELLGYSMPEYYHVPLLLAADGKRLSKREKSLDMQALRERFSPEELLGLLSCMAGLRQEAEPVRLDVLVKEFSWDKVKKENIFTDFF